MPEPLLDGHLKGTHVLILEDEMLIRMDLEETLRDLGCGKVTSVGRADEALAAMERDPVTFAMLDIQLGGGTSFEVAAALQELGVPFIFTSGSEEGEVPEPFAGIVFLGKPFQPAALASALAAALELRRPEYAGPSPQAPE
jgi:CheY-like chemotaxis protein